MIHKKKRAQAEPSGPQEREWQYTYNVKMNCRHARCANNWLNAYGLIRALLHASEKETLRCELLCSSPATAQVFRAKMLETSNERGVARAQN